MPPVQKGASPTGPTAAKSKARPNNKLPIGAKDQKIQKEAKPKARSKNEKNAKEKKLKAKKEKLKAKKEKLKAAKQKAKTAKKPTKEKQRAKRAADQGLNMSRTCVYSRAYHKAVTEASQKKMAEADAKKYARDKGHAALKEAGFEPSGKCAKA